MGKKRAIPLAVLAGLSGSLLGLSAFLYQERIAERWYIWSFELSGDSGRENALNHLDALGSEELIPLCFVAMEENGPRNRRSKVAAVSIILRNRAFNIRNRIIWYAQKGRVWDGPRFKAAFKKIAPNWNGEFDEQGINEFLFMLDSSRIIQ